MKILPKHRRKYSQLCFKIFPDGEIKCWYDLCYDSFLFDHLDQSVELKFVLGEPKESSYYLCAMQEPCSHNDLKEHAWDVKGGGFIYIDIDKHTVKLYGESENFGAVKEEKHCQIVKKLTQKFIDKFLPGFTLQIEKMKN